MAHDIESIISICTSYPEVKAVYLFGSRATGSADENSDYDIAVLCERGTSSERCGMLQIELNGRLCIALRTDAVDLVVMNTASSIELLYAIIQDGERLFDRGEDTDEYEMRRKHEYEDHIMSLKRAGFLKS